MVISGYYTTYSAASASPESNDTQIQESIGQRKESQVDLHNKVALQAVGTVFTITINIPSSAAFGCSTPQTCYSTLSTSYMANVNNGYFSYLIQYYGSLYNAYYFYSATSNAAVISSATYGTPTSTSKLKTSKSSASIFSFIIPIAIFVIGGLIAIYKAKVAQANQNKVIPGGVQMPSHPGQTGYPATAPPMPGQSYPNTAPPMPGQVYGNIAPAIPGQLTSIPMATAFSTQAYAVQPNSTDINKTTIPTAYAVGGAAAAPAYSVALQNPQIQGQSTQSGYYGGGTSYAGSSAASAAMIGVTPTASVAPVYSGGMVAPAGNPSSSQYQLPPSHPMYQSNMNNTNIATNNNNQRSWNL